MVNNPSHGDRHADGAISPERRIVQSYAAADRREGLAALLAFDDALAGILRTTREPMIGQMRLTWWHGAVTGLAESGAPAEPVLQGLARFVAPLVPGDALARVVEGWEELLDPEPLDAERLARFAEGRGAGLFEAAGILLGGDVARDPLAAGGRAWALADLAAHVSDAATSALAIALAQDDFAAARGARWRRQVRPLGALVHLAARPDASPPARAGRALWHRLTGR